MPTSKYSIEALKKWQDSVIDVAKKNLREEGELRPVALFLTEKMNIEESVMKMAVAMEPNSKSTKPVDLTSLDVHPSDTIVIVMGLDMSPEQILSVLRQTMPPVLAHLLTELEALGAQVGAPDPAATVANAFMSAQNINLKDVVALAVELIIKKTDAIAYIKVDETWMLETKNPEVAKSVTGSLENNPDAIEAITSFLETDGFVRMVSVEFRRNRPRTGRIIGFEKPKELIETATTDDGTKVSGRFSHLFDKAKARPKPPVNPAAN